MYLNGDLKPEDRFAFLYLAMAGVGVPLCKSLEEQTDTQCLVASMFKSADLPSSLGQFSQDILRKIGHNWETTARTPLIMSIHIGTKHLPLIIDFSSNYRDLEVK